MCIRILTPFVAGAVLLGPSHAGEHYLDLDPAKFGSNSHIIDNAWFPMKAGEQSVLEGWVIEEGEKIEHVFVQTVTDLTKVIGGVRVRVRFEEDYEDEILIEQEINFFAQDLDGNVWHLGERVEVFDESGLVGGKSWFVGVPDGAKAGIQMEAEPAAGGQALSQGYAPPPINWTDSGQVAELGVKVSVPAGAYSDVIVIDEWDMETDKGVFQTKYYARDVGLVQVGYKGDDPGKEELFLTEIGEVDAAEMDRVRRVALEIDGRGYSYNATSPAEISSD